MVNEGETDMTRAKTYRSAVKRADDIVLRILGGFLIVAGASLAAFALYCGNIGTAVADPLQFVMILAMTLILGAGFALCGLAAIWASVA